MSKTDGVLPHKDMVLASGEFSNPRAAIDKRKIGELADNIAVHGLMHPLSIWRRKEKGKTHNVILDGGRRWRAIGKLISAKKANGLSRAVPVRYIDAENLADAIAKALSANLQDESLTSYETTEQMLLLLKHGMKQKDIAKQLSKSATWVSRQLSAFKKAAPPVLAAWKSGKLPDDDVQSLAKLPPKEQAARLEKLMAFRDAGETKAPRSDRAKARRLAKGKPAAKGGPAKGEPTKGTQREIRNGKDKLEELLKYTEGAKSPYIKGMRDALMFSLGRLAHGEFDKSFREHIAKSGFKSDKKKK